MKIGSSERVLAIPETAWKKGTDFVFTDANTEFARLMGYSSVDNLLGTTDYELRCPASEAAEEFRITDQQVISSLKSLKMINIHKCATGLFAFLTKKSPSHDENGRLVGTFGRSINITQLFSQMNQLIFEDAQPYQKLAKGTYLIGYDDTDIKLSLRQQECLFFLLRGKTAKQIGQQLGLGHRTVESYLETIKIKLNCQNKCALIERAAALGLADRIPQHLLYQS